MLCRASICIQMRQQCSSTLFAILETFVSRVFIFLYHFVEEIENRPEKKLARFSSTHQPVAFMLITFGFVSPSHSIYLIFGPCSFKHFGSFTLLFAIRNKIQNEHFTRKGNGNTNESQNEKKKKRNLLTVLHQATLSLEHLPTFFFFEEFFQALLLLSLLSSFCRECKTEDK